MSIDLEAIAARANAATTVVFIGLPMRKENIEFFEHAKDDVAALLAEVERQTAEIAAVTAERDEAVAHGEWVEAKVGGMSLYPDGQKMCSVCGQIMPSRWETMPPFCFGCGAKMDKEAQDERND